MNALVLALAVLSGAGASGRQAPDVWITVDQEVLTAFERGGEAWEATPLTADEADTARPQVVAVAMPESRIEELVSFIHERYRRCGGFIAHGSREEALYAASQAAYSEAIERLPPPVPYTIDNGPVARAMVAAVQEMEIRNTITALSAFFTRHHNCPSGNASALSIRDKWLAYAAGRPDVTVELFPHTGYITQQPSVILTIQGTTFPSEVVVIGGHQDSIAGSNCTTSRSPGADDDASGIASISEVIRVAMALNFKPQRTVKFMAYAAEEVGLRGSNDIAQAFQSQGINVIGVLQLDMTNFAGTKATDIVIFTDFTNAAQNVFLRDVANLYVQSVGLPRPNSACGYGCSDHAAWSNRGFPASFPFESTFSQSNPSIHTANDTLATSGGDARHSVPFAKLAAAYMAEIAKGGFTAISEGRPATETTPARRRTNVKAARSGRKAVSR